MFASSLSFSLNWGEGRGNGRGKTKQVLDFFFVFRFFLKILPLNPNSCRRRRSGLLPFLRCQLLVRFPLRSANSPVRPSPPLPLPFFVEHPLNFLVFFPFSLSPLSFSLYCLSLSLLAAANDSLSLSLPLSALPRFAFFLQANLSSLTVSVRPSSSVACLPSIAAVADSTVVKRTVP